MTMREMQIFLEVARTLNMSTAGKSLYLSQSTVSQSILNIERRYNVQLFRRQSKHLILTKQGKILQDYCHQILELHRRLEYDLQHTGEKSLRIGTNLIVARSIFGELWNAYHLVCPDVQTKVSLEENEALLLKLQNFELYSVIIDLECNIPELVCREIADDEYFLICGTKSHFFNCKEARLADLKDENFFMLARGNPTRDYFEQSFHDHHLEPRTIDFNNIDIIKSKVIANEGISVMASGQFKVEAKLGYLRGISLPEIKFRRHFYEIHHKDLHILPHIQSYLDTCMFRSITEFSCLNGTLF